MYGVMTSVRSYGEFRREKILRWSLAFITSNILRIWKFYLSDLLIFFKGLPRGRRIEQQ